MTLETTLWNIKDHLTDANSIFYYLEAELEQSEPPYAARALRNVMEVRGGLETLSKETGIPAAILKRSYENEDEVDRATLTKVMEAYRPKGESTTRVA